MGMKWISFIFLCILFTSVRGQNPYSLSGVVKDLEKRPLGGVSVRLLSVKDSLFLAGAVSDEKGNFSLSTSRKECVLDISCIGYLPRKDTLYFSARQKSLDLGEILLPEDTVLLDGVTVSARAIAISMRGDTLEYNADSYAVPEYATVRDLLQVLPNVKVTPEGKITVQGEEIKKILVDGKEYFSGDPDLASKTLPSRMVDKVQVLKRESEADRLSGFGSGEKESVINLTVKEKMKVSIMPNLTAGWGRDFNDSHTRYSSNAAVSVMNDKDFYSVYFGANNTSGSYGGGESAPVNVGVNINKTFSEKHSMNGGLDYNSTNSSMGQQNRRTTFLPGDEILYENTSSQNDSHSKRLNLNLSGEWNPNKQHTLIYQTHFNTSRDRNLREERFGSFNTVLDTLYNGHAENQNKGKNYDLSFFANYAYRFRKEGRVLNTTFNVNYGNRDSRERYDWVRRLYSENEYVRDSLMNQRTETDNSNWSVRYNLSYVEPLWKKSFFQIMYSLDMSHNEDIRSTYGNMPEYNYSPELLGLLPRLSNATLQNSNIHRFTLNFKSVREKYEYTLGVNWDLNHSANKNYQPSSAGDEVYVWALYEQERLPNVRGDSLLSDVRQDYLNFSPVANFMYRFNKNTNLRIDYQGYMRSPSTQQLRDFTDVSNPTNSVKGNPDLKPQFQNMLFMNFSGSNPEKQSYYNVSLQARYVANEIKSVTTLDPVTGNRMTTYQNVNGNWSADMRSFLNIPLGGKKRFSWGNTVSVSYSRMKSFVNGEPSVTTPLRIEESPRISYNSNKFRANLEAMWLYSDARNSTVRGASVRTRDWGARTDLYWMLPWDVTLESRLQWTKKSGYGENADYSETLWEAAVSKRWDLKKYGGITFRFSADDILQNRKNFNRYVGNGYISDSTTSLTGSYFLCSIIYNFTFFPNDR